MDSWLTKNTDIGIGVPVLNALAEHETLTKGGRNLNVRTEQINQSIAYYRFCLSKLVKNV